MSDNPEQIRAEIERTRNDLSIDVDAVADKVTPAKVAQRQTDKVRGALSNVKDSVLGSASDAQSRAGDAAGGAKAKAKGNPVGLGLVAFGAGLLIASLIPASDKEKELASTVKDKAQPLVEKATDAAKDVAGELKEPAQQAAQQVAGTARDSAETVRSEAQSAAQDVEDSARDAKRTVQDDARG